MASWSADSPAVVIDASLAIHAVVPTDRSAAVDTLLRKLLEADRRLTAPAHWSAEVISSLRKLHYHGLLSRRAVDRAVSDLAYLEVELVIPDVDLCRAALVWAERLTQAKAYDAFYLAVAEAEGVHMWTMDQRLGRRAHQIGADWVRVFEGADTEE